jgi:hypothetical protein
VVDVASAEGFLYALTINNTATRVWQKDAAGSGWTPVDPPDAYGFIQNIFGAEDALFATGAKSAGNDYDYAILYKKSNQFELVKEIDKAVLTGAGKVGGDYYLAARGKGIYRASDADPALALATATPSAPSDIAGLFQAEKNAIIIGISKGGSLVRIDSSGPTVDGASLGGNYYSGALSLMDNPEDPPSDYDKLLLVGIKDPDSLYKQGYMELRFKSSDGTHGGTTIPGENQPSSVNDYRQYDSSLRRYPVAAFWVLPKSGDAPQVIFAVTSNQGLYSYRNRSDGGWQWNHEE